MGSKHPYMTKGNVAIVLLNPHHGEDVDVKLIKEIIRVAGISRDEWLYSMNLSTAKNSISEKRIWLHSSICSSNPQLKLHMLQAG
jgi:hypothetical protein